MPIMCWAAISHTKALLSNPKVYNLAAQQLNFNASNDNNTFDNRSENKGPEPEGIVVGQVGDRTYGFIGLERIGGVMVYDITNPY